MEERNDFYVYVHTRATDGRIFYVGKGMEKRAWSKYSRNKHWKHIVAKYGYNVAIVQDSLTDEQSLTLEIMLIADIGRENLCNLTDGGDGSSGLIHSEEAKRKVGDAQRGKKITEEHRRRISEFHTGKQISDETRIKMSAWQKGKPGKKWSPESIAKREATRARYRLLKQQQLNDPASIQNS